MNCESLEELLSAYIDGELSESEKMAVSLHLDECPRCRKVVHDFRGMSEIVQESFGTVFAPEAFEQLVAQNIVEIQQGIQTRRLSLIYLASAIFGFFVILSLSISPVGHFVKASFRLSFAIFHGSINLLSVVSNVWFVMIGAMMLMVFVLSFALVVQLFRKVQSEALL